MSTMEEKMIMKGLRRVDSSELMLPGGAKSETLTKVIEKIRNFFDFIADYIPKLIKGFSDGMVGKSLF